MPCKGAGSSEGEESGAGDGPGSDRLVSATIRMHLKVLSRLLTYQINVSSIGTLENKGTQLDSHAIMVVGGKFCEVISKLGMTEEVSGFVQDIGILS